MVIAQKLKELREEKGITQRELAKLLKIAPSTLAMYEVGKREPDYEMLSSIANFFNVSTDYLLGRTEDKINTHKYISKYNGHPMDPDLPFKEKTLADAMLKISAMLFEFNIPDEIFYDLVKRAVKKYGPPGGVGHIAAHGPSYPGSGALNEGDGHLNDEE